MPCYAGLAGCPTKAAAIFNLGGKKSLEFLRRRRFRLEAELRQDGPEFGGFQAGVDLAVEPVDNSGRQSGGPRIAQPHIRVESDLRKSALDHGGNIGQPRRAGRAGVGERPDASVLDQRNEIGNWRKVEVDAAAQQVGAGLLAAGVGNEGDVGAGGLPECFGQDVRGRSEPQAEDQRAGVGLGVGDELRDRPGRNGRRHHHHVRPRHGGRDRRQAFEQVNATVGVGHREIAQHVAREQQRVAIGRRRGDRPGSCGLAGAGPVLDDDALAQARLKLLRDHPPNGIGGRTGRGGHDDLDDPVRIGLRRKVDHACAEQGQRKGKSPCHQLRRPLSRPAAHAQSHLANGAARLFGRDARG